MEQVCAILSEGSLHYVLVIMFWFISVLTIKICLFHFTWNTLWVMGIWNLVRQWQQNRFAKSYINYRCQWWHTAWKMYKLRHTLLFFKYLVIMC